MQTQHILLQFVDGSVGVMQLVLNDGHGLKQTADAATINREIARADIPEVLGWRLITPADLPTTRRWRNCWRDRSNRIEVDMPLARAQRLAELRAERDQLLPQLDKDWMKAVGQGRTGDAAQIEAQRQALRDMPQQKQPLLDAAQTPDQLETVTL